MLSLSIAELSFKSFLFFFIVMVGKSTTRQKGNNKELVSLPYKFSAKAEKKAQKSGGRLVFVDDKEDLSDTASSDNDSEFNPEIDSDNGSSSSGSSDPSGSNCSDLSSSESSDSDQEETELRRQSRLFNNIDKSKVSTFVNFDKSLERKKVIIKIVFS